MDPEQPSPTTTTKKGVQKDREELARLEAKLATIVDPDIQRVLKARIKELREALPPVEEAPKPGSEPAPEPDFEPPTPEQMEEAESLIRQAHVEKVRGNRQAAGDLVRKAAEVAPGAYSVQEALGDDAMERHNFKEARKAYERALRTSPKNIALERKHAEAILKSESGFTVEQQMRLGISESPFLNPEDQVAAKNVAVLLNVFMPGVGQLVLGETKKGAVFLGLWLICLVGIVMLRSDFSAMMRAVFASDPNAKPTLLVLLPIFAALVVYFIALADLMGKDSQARHKVDRPKPPVDLPFE